MIELLLALTLTAQPAPPPVDKGWELKIERANPAEPVFVGEQASTVTLTVTLKNTSGKERGYVPVSRLIRGRVLEAAAHQPDGMRVSTFGHRRTPRDEFKDLTPLAADKEMSFSISLNSFSYYLFYKPGKHTVQMTYDTPDGVATSNTVTFEVINPPMDADLARHQLAPGGRTAQQPETERTRAFVEQVQVGEKVYLMYREYTGPKYGSDCSFAKRIDTLPGKVDMVVVGAHGARLPEGWERFHLAYPHKPNGMTVLRIQAVGCDIEERIVFEPTGDKDPKQGWGLFEQCKFPDRDNYPPETLRLTYAAFVASVKGGGQAKFCLRSVEVSDRADPERADRGAGINIPWMKENFSPDVVICRREADGTFFFRTNTSSLLWVETRTEGWKLFAYTDKPIK